jgi:hypothetical protein
LNTNLFHYLWCIHTKLPIYIQLTWGTRYTIDSMACNSINSLFFVYATTFAFQQYNKFLLNRFYFHNIIQRWTIIWTFPCLYHREDKSCHNKYFSLTYNQPLFLVNQLDTWMKGEKYGQTWVARRVYLWATTAPSPPHCPRRGGRQTHATKYNVEAALVSHVSSKQAWVNWRNQCLY